jgi:hypothetical protein
MVAGASSLSSSMTRFFGSDAPVNVRPLDEHVAAGVKRKAFFECPNFAATCVTANLNAGVAVRRMSCGERWTIPAALQARHITLPITEGVRPGKTRHGGTRFSRGQVPAI